MQGGEGVSAEIEGFAEQTHRQDRGSLHDDEGSATNSVSSEVNEVPRSDMAVVCRVLAHLREGRGGKEAA